MRAIHRLTHATLSLLGALGLAVAVACGGGGGGSSTPSATTLSYTDPTGVGATEYKFVKNGSSTAQHLVLDLMGPATATTGLGVSFELASDATKVTWTNAVIEGTTFNLGAAPKLIKSKLAAANANLQAGLFQKGTASPATINDTKALAQVSLDLKAGAAAGDVALSVVAGKAFISDATGTPSAIVVKVGALKAQ
ncbi:MAG TPA: hypothetical protein VJ623_12665 [Holophagaceae bacterium]|nr:hypothetical protein [Holophagaceae bacterium]